MIRLTLLRFFALAALLTAVLLPAQALAAYNPVGGINCRDGQIGDSAVCQTDEGNPVTGQQGVILRATRILAIIAGVAAVIVIVVAGISYITSNGDANTVAQAKNAIIFAVVGLVVITVSQGIISLVIRSI